ncbi:hypothetical protein ABMA27_010834 [Loxostege sticticalis]|uniref:C-type lectin domain-containing protein n=1 Tax=Loxostege sticticalis TaxID=481309 RepID=A0ABR3H342_LOXSC
MSPLFIILFFAVGLEASHRSFYRHDYTYVEEYDSFYKIHHNNEENGTHTFDACEEEGAELFYPNTRDEWTIVKKLVAGLLYVPIISLTDVFVGNREQFDDCDFNIMKVSSSRTPRWSFETYGEGPCVYLDINTGFLFANDNCVLDSTTRPFVCKKTGNVTPCPSIGYQYSHKTKKCYKINNYNFNWCKAMKTCIGQGGLLLMMESQAEVTVIKNEVLAHQYKFIDFYVGAKKLSPDQEYFTHVVTGNTVSELTTLSLDYEKHECLTIWEGEHLFFLSSKKCNETSPFICEMKVSV